MISACSLTQLWLQDVQSILDLLDQISLLLVDLANPVSSIEIQIKNKKQLKGEKSIRRILEKDRENIIKRKKDENQL